MSLIRIITGSESFQNGSSGLIAQIVKCNGVQTPAGKPMFISDAAKGATGGVTQPSRSIYLPASRVGLSEMGSWYDGTFDIPDGVVIRLFGRRQDRTRDAQLQRLDGPRRAVIFIRMRAEGALRRLTLNTIDDDKSSNLPVIVEGRFDILSLREAGAAGVAITQEDLQLTKVDAVRGVLVHQEVSGQRSAPDKVKRETIKTSDGEVTINTTRRPRAINLGD